MAKSAGEAAKAFEELGGKIAVVKSQIHAGGRGKGRFKEFPDQAGVVLVKSAAEAKQNAERMLGKTLVTKQTGPAGKTVKCCWWKRDWRLPASFTWAWSSIAGQGARS